MGKKHRRPVEDMRHDQVAVIERIQRDSVAADNGCRIWVGDKNHLGYGNLQYKGKRYTATRLIYAALYGAFDKDLDICHSCDNPSCVNPAHLRADTHKNNLLDASKRRRLQGQWKKECHRGHPLEGDNLYVSAQGFRSCKRCDISLNRVNRGWPESIAFSDIKIPRGFMLCRETWTVIPVRGRPSKS